MIKCLRLLALIAFLVAGCAPLDKTPDGHFHDLLNALLRTNDPDQAERLVRSIRLTPIGTEQIEELICIAGREDSLTALKAQLCLWARPRQFKSINPVLHLLSADYGKKKALPFLMDHLGREHARVTNQETEEALRVLIVLMVLEFLRSPGGRLGPAGAFLILEPDDKLRNGLREAGVPEERWDAWLQTPAAKTLIEIAKQDSSESIRRLNETWRNSDIGSAIRRERSPLSPETLPTPPPAAP